MDIASKNLCMGCMNPLPQGQQKCPKCGYSQLLPYNVEYLPPSSMVGKYLIGKMLYANGESAVYLGFDTEAESKVWVREFMPVGAASRNHATHDVMPNSGKETVYKYFMASFEDLYRTLQRWNGQEGHLAVTDILYQNNTVYAVEKYVETVTLSAYLKENGGELPWAEAKKMLLPLFNFVANLHAKGIMHLGITPEHILVNEKGQLFLGAFSIPEARMQNQDMVPETFDGYSAPEQYEAHGAVSQSADVYALGAVTYRVLTGTRPQSGNTRCQDDGQPSAMELNDTVPESVSDAISGAMVPDPALRAETVDEFTTQLLENVSGNTAVYHVAEELPNENTVHLLGKGQKPYFYTGVTMAATVLVLGIVAIVAYNAVVGSNEPPEEEQTPPPPVQEETQEQEKQKQVPDLEGKLLDTVTANAEYNKEFYFQIKEEYSETYPAGIIITQQPRAGTPMVNKGTIILTVSKGSENIPMPDLVQSNLDFAMKMLTEQSITYKVYIVENNDYPPGTVFRTEPVSGSMVKIDSPSPVLVYATPPEEEDTEKQEEKESGKKPSKKKDNDEDDE